MLYEVITPWLGPVPGRLGDLLRWLLIERVRHRRAADPPAAAFPIVEPTLIRPRAAADAVTLTWIGHATFLVQIGSRNVLRITSYNVCYTKLLHLF